MNEQVLCGWLERIAVALERQCEQHDESVQRAKRLRQENLNLHAADSERAEAAFQKTQEIAEKSLVQIADALTRLDCFQGRLAVVEKAIAVGAVDPADGGTRE